MRRIHFVRERPSKRLPPRDSFVQRGIQDLRVEHGGFGNVPVGAEGVAVDDLVDEAAGCEVHLCGYGVWGAGAAEAEDHVDGGFFVDAVVVEVAGVWGEG